MQPAGVALDSSGNLYVADHGNNRVLFYPSGSTTATRVYGQLRQLHHQHPEQRRDQRQQLICIRWESPWTAAAISTWPTTLTVGCCSIPPAAPPPRGSTGSGGSFTTNTQNNGGISANSLYEPVGVALDSSGNLYVADTGNSRVLFYPSGSTTATRVYGQLRQLHHRHREQRRDQRQQLRCSGGSRPGQQRQSLCGRHR